MRKKLNYSLFTINSKERLLKSGENWLKSPGNRLTMLDYSILESDLSKIHI